MPKYKNHNIKSCYCSTCATIAAAAFVSDYTNKLCVCVREAEISFLHSVLFTVAFLLQQLPSAAAAAAAVLCTSSIRGSTLVNNRERRKTESLKLKLSQLKNTYFSRQLNRDKVVFCARLATNLLFN